MMDRSRLSPALLACRVRDQIVRLWVRHGRSFVFITALTSVVPILALAVCWHLFPFPWEKLAPQPVGAQVTDRSGRLMLERVAADDQRRHPVSLEQISPWLLKAVIAVEDERFESHHGVDLFAVVRAAGQNLWAGRKISGASTITMQLCKMIDERPRTWNAKLMEGLRALQLLSLIHI
jgi:penicillin-binding protein 1C